MHNTSLWNKRTTLAALGRAIVLAGLVQSMPARAHNKVVVIPMGDDPTGNATAADVLSGKTFSNATGSGKTGTLKLRDGSVLYTNSIGMEFSLLPAGSFIMGSPDGTGDVAHRPVNVDESTDPTNNGGNADELQHSVLITKPFYMQTTEVTQKQYLDVTGNNPHSGDPCGLNCPVAKVSWNDVQNFIDALNALENRTNCNTQPNTCYALPTEAQWEYAARAGTITAFYNGRITSAVSDPKLNLIAWYSANSGGNNNHPVAQKLPNQWGLYDMLGNVWEWVRDWYGVYPDGPFVSDPTGPVTGTEKVIRGGSIYQLPRGARSGKRLSESPGFSFSTIGFRIILPSN